MTVAVRYYTRSGNTQKLAEAIAAAVGVPAEPVSVPLPEKADILFLGSSPYAFDVDEAVKAFVAANAANIGTIYNFGTSASPNSTRKLVARLAAAHGVNMAGEEFHCFGSFLMLHRGRPNAEDCAAAAAFAKKVVG